ncbi:MAG TPA: nucleotide sugar dehydrogenase [Stellaceae bacterium]|nr:nucleotide sugar dehydrogenase [Stellaceae bacterium]
MLDPKVAFVGMTHLGLNSAVAGAGRGFSMVCFDTDVALIERLNAGIMPVVEPDLDALAAKHRDRLTFTADPAYLRTCDVVYVAPDVATDDQGGSDLSVLDRLLSLAFDCARDDAVIVVLSQVPPGYSRAHQRPGRHLIYQVETLIFGQAVARALNPERTIIGVASPNDPLPAAYKAYLDGHGNPPLLTMRYESAELAKISINCCLVASVSVANTLAELCAKIGADWSEIVPALKLDRRIGPYSYLTPGLGISGGNLERDLATLVRFADERGTHAGVVRAWIDNSRYAKDWALRTLHQVVLDLVKQPCIAVLGLAYKQDTHSTKNSPSLALIGSLGPFDVAVYDPVVPATAAPHPQVRAASSELDCMRGADALVIMTSWGQFKTLAPAAIKAALRGDVVIDPHRVLDPAAVRAAGLRYFTLGTS